MKAFSQQQHELAAYLVSAFEDCQLHRPEAESCLIHSLKQMSPAERAEWLYALHESELQFLASYHHICLHNSWASDLASVSALRSTHPPPGEALPNCYRARAGQ